MIVVIYLYYIFIQLITIIPIFENNSINFVFGFWGMGWLLGAAAITT